MKESCPHCMKWWTDSKFQYWIFIFREQIFNLDIYDQEKQQSLTFEKPAVGPVCTRIITSTLSKLITVETCCQPDIYFVVSRKYFFQGHGCAPPPPTGVWSCCGFFFSLRKWALWAHTAQPHLLWKSRQEVLSLHASLQNTCESDAGNQTRDPRRVSTRPLHHSGRSEK